MGNKTRRMGERTGKYLIAYSYNQRTETQQEIGRRNQKLRRQENSPNYNRYPRRGNKKKDIPRILPARSNRPDGPL